jgi:hypothetical protein
MKSIKKWMTIGNIKEELQINISAKSNESRNIFKTAIYPW